MVAAVATQACAGQPQGSDALAAPPTTVPSLTVTPPPKPLPPPSDAAVQAFIRSHAAPSRIGQLARWGRPICPKTAGVDPEKGAVIVQHIAQLAELVGAPVAPPGCRPNLAVIVSDNPQSVLDYVRVHLPDLLGYHYISQERRIATVRFPIQAWYVTATRGSNGDLIVDDSCCNAAGARAGSRLTSDISSELVSVVVVIDATLLARRDLGAIADDVAVLGLSQANPSHACGDIPSILDVGAPDCPEADKVVSATDGDVAFLKALYATDPRVIGSLQRSNIADAMRRDALTRPSQAR